MSIFRLFKINFWTKHDDSAVKDVAREALTTYEKTFVDLARYDRGELSRPVSR